MPKEVIKDDSQPSAYDVRVGWQRDSYVQVGVETSDGYSLITMLYGSDDKLARIASAARIAVHDYDNAQQGSPVELGRLILNSIEASPWTGGDQPDANSPEGYSYTGVWATLSRDSLNRLVRVLRKARDQAFGADA